MFWNRIDTVRAKAPMLRAGPLTIDRGERRARIDGHPLELSPLLLRLLEHVAQAGGRVVTRAELKRVLWPYAERIDTERRLNTAMRALRYALGDDAEAPRFIATVRGSGYRWIAKDREPRAGRLAFAAIALAALSLSPRPAAAPADLGAALRAQSAMEQWRREPNAGSASQAAALLSRADGGGSPSILAMRAELELGADWRWSAAERDLKLALDRDPGNADARLGLAWLRVDQGRKSEAVALVAELVKSGVQSGDRRASLGWLLIRAGRPDLAAQTCGRDQASTVNDLSCSHESLAALGRYAEAKAVSLRLMARVPADAAAIRNVEERAPRDSYRAFLAWRAAHFLPADAAWFQKAQVLADAGETAAAIDALERSVKTREPLAVKIASTPSFLAMRGNARFERLVAAVGA